MSLIRDCMPDKASCQKTLESCFEICYADNRKGEATEAAYPHTLYNLHLYDVSRQLVLVVGGYFFSLKI